MDQVDPNSTRRKALWATLAIATVRPCRHHRIAGDLDADPEPSRAVPGRAVANAGVTSAASPGATPTPATPPPGASRHRTPSRATPRRRRPWTRTRHPHLTRTPAESDNAVGGFSFVVPPAGWSPTRLTSTTVRSC